MLTEIVSAVLQLAVFTLIPFIAYLISKRKARGFLNYLGLYKANKKALILAIGTSTILLITGVGLTVISPEIREHMFAPNSMTGKFRLMGISFESGVILLMAAWVKTSLAEEILFRGFIAKRLMAFLGYQWGNIIQATIFGLVHVVLFYFAMDTTIFFMIFIFLLSGIAAYVMAYINEKLANGSIVPGWVAHGLGNMASYTVIAYAL